eukprot:CAMPEP_0184524176 /NCGR_PEP_ID=MMETSP0198_2-20121128/9350_1 /TAXON_ID=1112570 /ORGANISM="Thraustochytrium sp., Strain LLF1b" /LENGTH=226 /DNA_ID=CAMNT_0026915401 /DNA_START=206 /DNA_END=883 /DNA_ORIENTATION=+
MGPNGVLLSSHLFRHGRKKYTVQSITGKSGVSKVDQYFFPVNDMFPGVTHTGTLRWRADVCVDSNEFCSRPLKGKWVTETTFDEGMVLDPVDEVYFCDDAAAVGPVGYTETRQLNRPWSEGSVNAHWHSALAGEVCMDSNEFCSRLLKGKWVTETTFDDGMVVDPVDKVYFCDDEATARPVGYTETRQLNRPWSEGSVVRWRGHEGPVERQATGLLAFDEQGGRVS